MSATRPFPALPPAQAGRGSDLAAGRAVERGAQQRMAVYPLDAAVQT